MHKTRSLFAGVFALSLVAGTALAADKTGDVKGIVYTESGKPLADATVRLLHRNDDDKLAEVDTATTDKNGKFDFDDVHNGTYVVVAVTDHDKARDRTTITVKDGKDVKGIELKPRKRDAEADERDAKREVRKKEKDADLNYARLSGTATHDGKAVKNATVKLLSGHDTDYDKMRVIATVETDEDGDYKFPRVEQGDYTVYIKANGAVGTRRLTINPHERGETIDVTLK